MKSHRFCYSSLKRLKGNTKSLMLITICWNKAKTWFKNTRSFRQKNQNWEMTSRPRFRSTPKAQRKSHSYKKLNPTNTIKTKSKMKNSAIYQYLYASQNLSNQKIWVFRTSTATTTNTIILLMSRSMNQNLPNRHRTAVTIVSTKLFHLHLNSCTLEKIRRIRKINSAPLPLLVVLAFLEVHLPKRSVRQDCLLATLSSERY